MDHGGPLLTIDGVTHRYGREGARPAVVDVSLALQADEILALVGESGCGKTTLGKIVAGLLPPTAGRVTFDGHDIYRVRGRERAAIRRAIQLVHQDPYASLNPALTIEETLTAGLRRHGLATSRRAALEAAEALLRTVELPADREFLQRYPHQLSGGQRQRVGIARALALEPRLIVADEPVSMLDVSVRVAVLNLLLDLKARRHLAYLFITHDFGVVRHFADGHRIAVLYYGKVVETGRSPAIIRRPHHPYTFALLNAVPVPDPARARRRTAWALSEPADPRPADRGCPFAPRCPFAETICRETDPPLRPVDGDSASACHFPDRVPALSVEATG